MKKIVFLFVLFSSQFGFSQITPSPKIERRSAPDTYISQIELTDKYTIVSMYFKTKSTEERINEYFENNPRMAEEYRKLSYIERKMRLEQLRMLIQMEEGSNQISINPKSYLQAKSGEKFDFIKATGIPVLPEELNVLPDKRYSFKVYYERVSPGLEMIDFIEGSPKKGDTRQYWNFYGIKIINPANKPLAAKPAEKKIEQKDDDIDNTVSVVLSGKVFDSKTNAPISAKIVCIVEKNNERYDSLQTPRSGNFMFDLAPNAYLYEISANGYQTSIESFDFSKINKTQNFSQNFYLNAIEKEKTQPTTEVKAAIMQIDSNLFRLDKVYFSTGQANILPESYQQLDGLVEMMKKNNQLKIRVDGHTDNVGDTELNKKLSLDRAFNVRQYLIDKGIAGERVHFKGFGDTKPIAPNDSEENKRKNRRVEFVIIEE